MKLILDVLESEVIFPHFYGHTERLELLKSFMTWRCRYEKSQEVRLGIQAGGRSSGY